MSQPVLSATSFGKLPTLAYSDGEDRLGATKLGYIDTNISMKIIDSSKDLYHVQLSKNHSAYIDKSLTQLGFGCNTCGSKSIMTRWLVKGDSAFDYVSISLGKKLPYKTWMDANFPTKIMVDIYGAQANTNWITQLSSAKEVKNVFFEQTEDDVVRVTIQLWHPQPWGYHIFYQKNDLQIQIKHRPEILNINQLTIAIDAGHGGTNLGADGETTKTLEKNLTPFFAQNLQKILLAKGAKVIMTRETDTTYDNKDRVLFLQNQWPDLLISFHLNSSGNPSTRGVSTYYKHVAFRPFTQALLHRLLQIDDLKEYGNVGNFNFQLIQPTEFNSSLVEVAFLSNLADEKMILNPNFRQQVAEQVAKGIEDWLNILY